MRYKDADNRASEILTCTEQPQTRGRTRPAVSVGRRVFVVKRPGKVLWRRWDASWAPEEDRTRTDGSGVNGGLFVGRGKAGSRAKSRVRRSVAHSVDNAAALEWEPGLCGGEGWW